MVRDRDLCLANVPGQRGLSHSVFNAFCLVELSVDTPHSYPMSVFATGASVG